MVTTTGGLLLNCYSYVLSRYMLVQGTDFAQWQAEKHTNNCLDHKAQLKPHLFKDKGANVDEVLLFTSELGNLSNLGWLGYRRFQKVGQYLQRQVDCRREIRKDL